MPECLKIDHLNAAANLRHKLKNTEIREIVIHKPLGRSVEEHLQDKRFLGDYRVEKSINDLHKIKGILILSKTESFSFEEPEIDSMTLEKIIISLFVGRNIPESIDIFYWKPRNEKNSQGIEVRVSGN